MYTGKFSQSFLAVSTQFSSSVYREVLTQFSSSVNSTVLTQFSSSVYMEVLTKFSWCVSTLFSQWAGKSDLMTLLHVNGCFQSSNGRTEIVGQNNVMHHCFPILMLFPSDKSFLLINASEQCFLLITTSIWSMLSSELFTSERCFLLITASLWTLLPSELVYFWTLFPTDHCFLLFNASFWTSLLLNVVSY